MKNALDLVRQIIRRGQRCWILEGQTVTVRLPPDNRKQVVRIDQAADEIVLRSTVLGATRVTHDCGRWRNLARAVWTRNASHDFVSFAFGRKDRLIGVIRHPAATLEAAELELYIDTLARECDRFEYVLTGADLA